MSTAGVRAYMAAAGLYHLLFLLCLVWRPEFLEIFTQNARWIIYLFIWASPIIFILGGLFLYAALDGRYLRPAAMAGLAAKTPMPFFIFAAAVCGYAPWRALALIAMNDAVWWPGFFKILRAANAGR